MKKSSFAAMVLGTVSVVLFALGMCMALIPEWNAFKPGVIFGCVGLLLGLITLIVWRKMEHKEPLHITGKTVLTVIVGVVGALALGIGIQNYPEGTAVALPLLRDGMKKKNAFLTGSLSAAVEPLFGVLAAIVATFVTPLMPLLLAFAAGTMIYVVVQELLPEAQSCDEGKTATLGFIAGFLLMMILDVSLG